MNVIQFPKQQPPPGGFELPRALVAELAQGVAAAVLSGCNRLARRARPRISPRRSPSCTIRSPTMRRALQSSSHKRARGRRHRSSAKGESR
jgi:hypothetical protein